MSGCILTCKWLKPPNQCVLGMIVLYFVLLHSFIDALLPWWSAAGNRSLFKERSSQPHGHSFQASSLVIDEHLSPLHNLLCKSAACPETPPSTAGTVNATHLLSTTLHESFFVLFVWQTVKVKTNVFQLKDTNLPSISQTLPVTLHTKMNVTDNSSTFECKLSAMQFSLCLNAYLICSCADLPHMQMPVYSVCFEWMLWKYIMAVFAAGLTKVRLSSVLFETPSIYMQMHMKNYRSMNVFHGLHKNKIHIYQFLSCFFVSQSCSFSRIDNNHSKHKNKLLQNKIV